VTPVLGFDPLIGWRVWRVADGFLLGVASELSWLPQFRYDATCEHQEAGATHAAPDRNCTCGISAFKSREDAELLARETAGSEVIVLGRVSLWGRVIETERGYRAARAYPYDLELLGGTKELALELRNRYVVDVALGAAPVATGRS
jgi:hypothetical protein